PGRTGRDHPQVKTEIKLDRIALEQAVVADAGGWASEAEQAALAAEPLAWAAALRRLIHETDDAIVSARALQGDIRDVVLDDLTSERERLAVALLRLSGDAIDPPAPPQAPVPAA